MESPSSKPPTPPTTSAQQRNVEPCRPHRGKVHPLALLAMPFLAVIIQFCTVRLAHALGGTHLGPDLLRGAAHSPWAWIWIGAELLALAAWTKVLSEVHLSAAFPMTALGYVLVVGMGWIAFHEPLSALQVLGAAAILAGVWLLKDEAA